MLTVEVVSEIVKRWPTYPINGCSINRPVAMGVINFSGDGADAWLVANLGDPDSPSELHLVNDVDPVEELHAEIAISANIDSWEEMARLGKPGVIQACDERKVTIQGKLPYFIRHAEGAIALMLNLARELFPQEE
jgi:hypothetical protein